MKSVTSQVRSYQPGDESRIVDLSNRSLATYAGWVPRTVENWRWSILSRPGVRATDILVLETAGKLDAYAVLGPEGDVLNFVVDPDQRPRTRRSQIKELARALEDRARSRDCDVLMFSLPATDRMVDKALRAAGYVVERSEYYSVGILNSQVLLQRLLTARHSRLHSLRGKAFILELAPGQYPFLLMTRLGIRLDAGVQVDDLSDACEYPRDCVIRIDLSSLTELIFCRVSVDALLAQSQLEIQSDSGPAEARELLNALVIDADWHLPLYDGF